MSACQIGLLFISTDEQWYLCSMDILHVRHSFMALLMKWRVNGLTALPASAWQTQHEKDWLMHHVPWWVSRSVSPFHDNREVDVLLSISTSHHLTRSTHLWFLLASGVANFGKRCFWGANSCSKWKVRSAWQSLGRQLSVYLIPRWPEDSPLVRWFSMDLWMHFGLSWIPKDTLSTCEGIWQDMYVVLAKGILWGQWTPCLMITRSSASLRVRSFPSRHRWGPMGGGIPHVFVNIIKTCMSLEGFLREISIEGRVVVWASLEPQGSKHDVLKVVGQALPSLSRCKQFYETRQPGWMATGWSLKWRTCLWHHPPQ